MFRVAQAQSGKNTSRSREQEGEEEVAEEMMEVAYTRYLQVGLFTWAMSVYYCVSRPPTWP